MTADPVILASASPARAALLQAAGVEFTITPADIDEASLRAAARRAGQGSVVCAVNLAIAKASRISSCHPEALVIGADQILVVADRWIDKASDLAEARAQLEMLRGRAHALVTAVCVVRGGTDLWHFWKVPKLTMRRFSDAFLDAYIAAEGEALLGSVGGYRLEGRGVQLFSRINGDHFAVLGLPLVELLVFLRARGVIPT